MTFGRHRAERGSRVKETEVPPGEKRDEMWCLIKKDQLITPSLNLHNLDIKKPRNYILWGSNEENGFVLSWKKDVMDTKISPHS